jgi:hypothetical protein
LRGRLTETRIALDTWIDAHASSRPGIRELARLEGMLAERRDLLEQLLKIDDDMLSYLVSLRTKARPDEQPSD